MAVRTTHLRKMFVNADGSVTRSADKGWVAFRVELLNAVKTADDKFTVAETLDFPKADLDAAMMDASAGYGLSQKLGDGVSGIVTEAAKQGFTPDAVTGYASMIKTAMLEMWEDILGGFWTEEREGGGGSSVTIVFQAVQAVFAKANIELTPAQLTGIHAKLATKEGREAFMARPDVKAEVAQIKAERAIKAAQDAAAKAGAVAEIGGADDLAALLG